MKNKKTKGYSEKVVKENRKINEKGPVFHP